MAEGFENDRDDIPREYLEAAFDALPPDSVVSASNPGSLGMDRIIAGIALSSITLNFLALNYLLPAIGSLLLLLGFRSLHRENAWFKAAYICSILRLAILAPQLILSATVYTDALRGSLGNAILFVSCAVQMMMLFSFWMATNALQKKAGVPERSMSAGALFVWYAVTLTAALLKFNGTLAVVIMLASFVMIIKNLIKLEELMEANRYLVTASPVRIGDSVLAKLLSLVIVAGIVCGYAFFSSYNMHWTPAEAKTGGAVYDRLLALGYPEAQLRELSSEELELLKDADCVVAEVDERPLNAGVEVTEYDEGGGKYIRTEHPVRELTFTHVAVRIAGDGSDGEKWRVYHHFALDDALKFRGTADLQLWSMESAEGWSGTDDLSGKLFCTKKGEALCADFYFLGKQSYEYTDFFGQLVSTTNCMCDFSMPNRATDRRGYVAYTSTQITDGYLLNSWINYTHPLSSVQYPVKTANEYVREGMHIRDHPFITAQSALQFYVRDGKPVF